MNIQECDVLNALRAEPAASQRMLAESCGHSLGMVNRCLKELARAGYLNEDRQLTPLARREFARRAPRNAVILAAGPGIRMIPINTEVPKAFLEIDGEPLIERLLKQLHEAGIWDVYVVTGYKKEQFEYLIDDYGVQLIVNPDYSLKNNLYSLRLAAAHLDNSYILPCDIWCGKNPFSSHELYSWYMVSEQADEAGMVRANRKGELVRVPRGQSGNAMPGIAYLLKDDCDALRTRMEQLCENPESHGFFWEAALFDGAKMTVNARLVPAGEVIEINTYEQLRQRDSASPQLESDKLNVIAAVLGAGTGDITDITVLKKGMTNRSFLFTCRGSRYIMRIPGEGTDRLIDRRQEAAVCRLIQDRQICEDIVFIDPDSGYKITRFIEGARTCNASNPDEVTRCMDKLRAFHRMGLKTGHAFNIFEHIEFYESLWQGQPSAYRRYRQTKADVLSLKPYIDAHAAPCVLTHIDAVPDNFLIFQNARGDEEIRLIDWEYAAMQDPHVDLAMFCIYALYDRAQVDRLIDTYFCGRCPRETRIKIYCYIAACGLLWSNWCEYKRNLGVEFGEYSLRQYRYAKDYYRIVRDELAGTPDALPASGEIKQEAERRTQL